MDGVSKHAGVAWSRGSGHTLYAMRPPWLAVIVGVSDTTEPVVNVAVFLVFFVVCVVVCVCVSEPRDDDAEGRERALPHANAPWMP